MIDVLTAAAIAMAHPQLPALRGVDEDQIERPAPAYLVRDVDAVSRFGIFRLGDVHGSVPHVNTLGRQES